MKRFAIGLFAADDPVLIAHAAYRSLAPALEGRRLRLQSPALTKKVVCPSSFAARNSGLNKPRLMKMTPLSFLIFLFFVTSAVAEPIALKFETLGSIQGTEKWDWWQACSAYVPGEKPMWLTTMSQTGKTGSHDFHDILQSVSRDGGQTWSEPEVVPSLKRTP